MLFSKIYTLSAVTLNSSSGEVKKSVFIILNINKGLKTSKKGGVTYNFCKKHALLYMKFRRKERDTHPENRTFGNS